MARVGKKWTTEEDELLREEVKNKMNYEEIAENHKRNIIFIFIFIINFYIIKK